MKVQGVRSGRGWVQVHGLGDGWAEVPDLGLASRRWVPVVFAGAATFAAGAAQQRLRHEAWQVGVAGALIIVLDLGGVWVTNRWIGARAGRDLHEELVRRLRTGSVLDAALFFATGRRSEAMWPGFTQAGTVAAARHIAAAHGYRDQVRTFARADLAEVVVRKRWLRTTIRFRLASGAEDRYVVRGFRAPERLTALISYHPGACTGAAGTTASTRPRRTRR